MLANYAELQAGIADELKRVDQTSAIKRWIYLCEQELNLVLQRREMEQRAVANTVGGKEAYALPVNYGTGTTMLVNGEPITELTASDFTRMKTQHQSPGRPQKFAVVQNEFLLGPVPEGVYQLELHYYKTIPNLSDSNITHWVLTHYPAVMFYGALSQGAAGKHVSMEQAQKWVMAYKGSRDILIHDQIVEGSLGGGPFLQVALPFGVGRGASILTGE